MLCLFIYCRQQCEVQCSIYVLTRCSVIQAYSSELGYTAVYRSIWHTYCICCCHHVIWLHWVYAIYSSMLFCLFLHNYYCYCFCYSDYQFS